MMGLKWIMGMLVLFLIVNEVHGQAPDGVALTNLLGKPLDDPFIATNFELYGLNATNEGWGMMVRFTDMKDGSSKLTDIILYGPDHSFADETYTGLIVPGIRLNESFKSIKKFISKSEDFKTTEKWKEGISALYLIENPVYPYPTHYGLRYTLRIGENGGIHDLSISARRSP